VVLELSSFQLEDLNDIRRSPHIALVTTFTPNHLDRHASLQTYRDAKQSILRHQSPDQDVAILNADDPDVRKWRTVCRTLYYGLEDHGLEGSFYDRDRLVLRSHGVEREFHLADVVRLPGTHNLSNAAGAACCANAMGVEADSIRAALWSFRTLPHRLEPVLELEGRQFYDDSIATTPESTLAALEAIDRPIWLIAGGYDKGLDLNQVALKIADLVRGVALIGQTAPSLNRLLRETRPPQEPLICEAASMEEAVEWCYANSRAGDAILLSPACASFGMFQNFVHRAEVYRQAVDRLRWLGRKAG